MFRNIKHTQFYDYIDGNVYDVNILLPESHIIYEILKRYPIPKHLHDIKIVKNSSIEEADNNLVFIGKDKNEKIQYYYGFRYVNERKDKKTDIFLKTYDVIELLKKHLNDLLNSNIKSDKIEYDFVIASLVLLELKTFIRLGKQISFEQNNTFGIRNLEKKNFTFDKNGICIRFIGKKQVLQSFFIDKSNTLLVACLKKLYNKAETSVFSVNGKMVSEYRINNFLKEFDLTFKNLRTFGCNIIFLQHFHNLYKTLTKNMKVLIQESIRLAAEEIGHSKSISKGSYLIENLEELLTITLEKTTEDTDFDSFLKIFIQTINLSK